MKMEKITCKKHKIDPFTVIWDTDGKTKMQCKKCGVLFVVGTVREKNENHT